MCVGMYESSYKKNPFHLLFGIGLAAANVAVTYKRAELRCAALATGSSGKPLITVQWQCS